MRMSSRLIPSLIKGALVVALVAGTMACESEPPTAPSGSGAPVTETFSGTLQPGGEAFYAFSMPRPGVVSLTLTAMTGPSIPADALFPIGIGIPVAQFCSATVDAAAAPGVSPQFSVNKDVGVYCVKISDSNSRLGAPASFALNITHPR
jgi:hypothetical protein